LVENQAYLVANSGCGKLVGWLLRERSWFEGNLGRKLAVSSGVMVGAGVSDNQ
jgi:hypothetical protein